MYTRLSQKSLDALIRTAEKWNISGCPQFYYPEDVRREFLTVIYPGRWWDWTPCWAFPLRDFSNEVEVVAKALGYERVELARRIVELAGEPESTPVYSWLGEPFESKVTLYECLQAVESWIFYDLRPRLLDFISLNLDGAQN